MQKIESNKIIKEIFNMGYKIIGEYKNTNTYVDAIQIKTNYKVRVSYINLKSGKTPIIFGYGNPYCVDNMIMYINNNHPTIEIISHKQITAKPHNKTELFTLKCECGEVFNRKWWDINKNKYLLCSKCTKRKRGNTRTTNTSKKIKFLFDKGFKVINAPKILKGMDKILVETKEGYLAYTTYSRIHSGKGVFPFDVRSDDDIYIHNINKYCELNGIKTKAIEISKHQTHYSRTITFQCGECDEYFETSIRAFRYGKFRCSRCSNVTSNLEYQVEQLLKEYNINYIKEYSIKECKDILPLPFDFYLVDLNKIIEVDGIQHFKENSFFNNGSFDTIKKHDEIKNEYCKNNSIDLLRIPYLDFNKNNTYKDKILHFINIS